MKVREQVLKISEILADPNLQARVKIDQKSVAEYADAIARGEKLPPITVYEIEGLFYRVDGDHRLLAHLQAGHGSINATVKQGTYRDALIFACSANGKHGLRRTSEDRRRAILIALADPELSKLSNLKLAKICDVSDTFVGIVKRELEEEQAKPEPVAEVGDAWEPSPGQSWKPVAEPAETPHVQADQAEATPSANASKQGESIQPGTTDRLGKPLPRELRDDFADTFVTSTIETLEKLKTQTNSACNWNCWLDPESIDLIASLVDLFKCAVPFAVCPDCNGTQGGCASCKTARWVPECVANQPRKDARHGHRK